MPVAMSGVGLKGKTDASAKSEQEETPDKDRRDGYGNKTASAGVTGEY